jgi:hypothetical protein
MAMNFNIPELIELATKVDYNPRLATSVNSLIRARTSDQYNIAKEEVAKATVEYQKLTKYEYKDYGSGRNSFGLPIFQPLLLEHTEDKEQDLFLGNALVSYNQTKNVVQTMVNGRESSIKEFISNGDYQIQVTGFIYSIGYKYPIDKVIEFEKYMQKNVALKIQHEVLNSIGIYKVVVLDHAMPKTPQINIQTFSINLVSDKPLPLIINDLTANSQLL